MSDSLDRIENDFHEFLEAIEACKNGNQSTSLALKNAYDALYRLTQRYNKEEKSLNKKQQEVFTNKLRENHFIKGLLRIIRTTGTHISVGDIGVTLYTKDNIELDLSPSGSAASSFKTNPSPLLFCAANVAFSSSSVFIFFSIS